MRMRLRSRRIIGPPFPKVETIVASDIQTPLQIFGTDLASWHRADSGLYQDEGVTLATDNNDRIVQWLDRKNNVHLTNQNSSGTIPELKPTLLTAGLNGRPTLSFDYTKKQYFTSFPYAGTYSLIGISGTKAAMFVVGQMNSAVPSYGRCVGYAKEGDAGDWSSVGSASFIMQSSSSNICAMRSEVNLATKSVTVDAPRRFGCVFDGTNVTMYENNVAGTPVANNGTFSSPGTLMVSTMLYDTYLSGEGQYQQWDGLISEIVVVGNNHLVTEAERNALDAYFVDFWGF